MTEKRYGVISFLPGRKDKVILVTRKGRKDWIFPKGRRIVGKSGAQSALREAFEEGGLKGQLIGRKKARVISLQGSRKVQLTLYCMRVDKLLKRWPEWRERKRLIVSPIEARKLVSCPGMREGLKHLGKG